jgi:hypothetical protein
MSAAMYGSGGKLAASERRGHQADTNSTLQQQQQQRPSPAAPQWQALGLQAAPELGYNVYQHNGIPVLLDCWTGCMCCAVHHATGPVACPLNLHAHELTGLLLPCRAQHGPFMHHGIVKSTTIAMPC